MHTLKDANPIQRGNGRRKRSTGARTVGLIAVALVFFLPVIWMIFTAFKTTRAIVTDTIPLTWKTFIPSHPVIENFVEIFVRDSFGVNLWNSTAITLLQTVLAVVLASVAGYGFARIRFPGRNLLFMFCLIMAFIPIEAILVPEYRLIGSLGLLNTYAGVYLPFISSPFAIFLMRQSFAELPDEMFEAGELDGLGRFNSFIRLGLPNVKTALVTVVLIQFIWAWNAYIWPLVVLQERAMQTAQVSLTAYASAQTYPMTGEMFAAATSVTVPLVVLALVLQKYYVRGLVMSGGK